VTASYSLMLESTDVECVTVAELLYVVVVVVVVVVLECGL